MLSSVILALPSAAVLQHGAKQLPLSHEATALAVSRDGRRLAASSLGNARTVVYDLRFGRVLCRLGVSATALVFSPDGARLYTASSDRRAPSSRPSPESAPAASATLPVADPQGQTLRVWEISTGRCLSTEPFAGEAPIAISPDGATLAAAADRHTSAVLVLSADDGTLLHALVLPEIHRVRSLAFSPDGLWLCATTGVGSAVHWSTNDFERGLPPGVLADDVAVAFSSNSNVIATARLDCSVHVAAPGDDSFSEHVLKVHNRHKVFRGIEALELSPDGQIVVARGRSGVTQLFSTTLGKPLWAASPGPLAFMPDGKTIAAWWCGAVWLRDAQTGDVIVAENDDTTTKDNADSAPTGPASRPRMLRSTDKDGRLSLGASIAPVITEAESNAALEAMTTAAIALLGRLSTGWAESAYRKTALVSAKDPDGLGVRLPLRGGFAYVQIRPMERFARVLVQVTADEPDFEPPPSSSLVRLSRWIRDRLSAEARRQAAADREWAAGLSPEAVVLDVSVERAPGSLTIHWLRPTLPTLDDLEALVHAAEQKLA